MSTNDLFDDADMNFSEQEFQQDNSSNSTQDAGSAASAKTRQRIDELLEKKRLRELLDEDEWEL